MNCPKCGASLSRAWYGFSEHDDARDFACGTVEISTGEVYESEQCLGNQIANVSAERDALKSDQNDWRKGVEFIASALGEKSPPDLSCVRLALLAAEMTAERDALLAAARGMVEYIDSPKFGRMSDKQMMSLANLRTAIAKVEGTR